MTAGAILVVRVRARAGGAGIVGVHGGGIKIAVRSAPERGRANAELVAIVARALGVPPADVEVVAGATSADKRLRIRGLSAAELARRVRAAVAAGGEAGA